MRQLTGLIVVATLVHSAALGARQQGETSGAATVPAGGTAPAAVQTTVGGAFTNASESLVEGTVRTVTGQPLERVIVRARNLVSGEVGGTTTTAKGGVFSLTLDPGSYVLEVVDEANQLMATSSLLSATAGTSVSVGAITVTTGTLAAALPAVGLAGVGTTALRSITAAAAAAGLAGVAVPQGTPVASPSR